MLLSRQEAGERLAWTVASARAGAGGALALLGEPGSGKTTLLEAALARAPDAVVLRCTGIPVEAGLPHAALHGLLNPVVDRLPALPPLQRVALEVALARAVGPPPSPLLLGAASLSLLAAVAEDAPVVVVLDDAQWADEASVAALSFAARRLSGERVAVLLAARSGEVPDAVRALPACALGPLTPAEAAVLLADEELAPSVLDALVDTTSGSVLAAAELAHRLDAEQRSGRARLPTTSGADPFSAAVASLSEAARDAAALAALGADAPAPVLVAAGTALALPDGVVLEAEDAGLLVAAADGVRWRHPLARSAVLAAVPPARRRGLLGALAASAERHGAAAALVVGYRVAAAAGPDEGLALALDAVAEEASRSGDSVRAAREWRLAAATGTDPARRPSRLLEAADALMRAGLPARAGEVYDEALAAGLSAEGQARAHLARGRVEHTAGSPRRALVAFRAAAAVATDAPTRVRACAEGVLSAMYAVDGSAALALAKDADAAHDPGRAADRLLVLHARGVAAMLAGDQVVGRQLLASAVEEARREPVLDEAPDLLLWVVTAPLFAGGDPDADMDLIGPALDQLRLRGDLLWLPRVVRLLGHRHQEAGRPLAAYASYEEATELSRATSQTTQLVEALAALAELAALRGDREGCLAHVGELEQLLAVLDVPFLASHGWRLRGLLHLGLDEPGLAAAALAPAADAVPGSPWWAEAAADLVEALVLDGRPEEAARVVERVGGTGRAAALLEADDARAVPLLEAAGVGADAFTAARCRLLAGERLRRSGHRREAREHLRVAAAAFARHGAEPWRRRAEDGLRASGEVLGGAYAPAEELTGAELRVAALVAEGRPTREVAALLFLSPKTVEFHLGRIYRKLGVRGRAELAARLAASG